MLLWVSFCLHWPGSQKTWVFISLHRLQIRHSKILLILERPLPISYFTFYYFSFFLIFNRMDAWSLMRGDAFIHFVCGSRRVNIRLGVLLLIPKSPHVHWPFDSRVWLELAPKNFDREGCWLRKYKEKNLLNCKYKVTFQLDGCAEPTCAAACFNHFGFGYRLNNIRLLKCTFVVLYLFVYLLFLLVS